MSSSSNTKKRKGGAVCVGGDGGTVAAGLNDTNCRNEGSHDTYSK